MIDQRIVIVGGGHAAAQMCAGLVEAGMGGHTTLICGEAILPYQRPPLSKGFLKTLDEVAQLHRAETWYAAGGVTIKLGEPAIALDRTRRIVSLRNGEQIAYDRLVLATGGRARLLADLPAGLSNVATLRSAVDAQALRLQMNDCASMTIIGGGFIGLEFAATARSLGKQVTVAESAPRLLARAVSPEVSSHVLQVHRAAGIDIHLDARISGFEIDESRLAAIRLDGTRHETDLLLLGIGALPETGLAESAGLNCENGIVVDEYMVTSDPAILAIGDCTSFPDIGSGRRLRLESVQNANDQARTAIATLTGSRRPHNAVPWFWSEQGSLRLQMAGLPPANAERCKRPGNKPESFSIFHFADGVLCCVESVNAPLDHLMARKMLEAGRSPEAARVCDAAVPLKSLL
ncbi:MAG: FAD-dependent oxidoreductase [Lautropia sp.]|nr:FAD-dependent oxidoreductase [Lautropia sp.]